MLGSQAPAATLVAVSLMTPLSQAQTAVANTSSAAQSAAEPAMQVPADIQAYKAARSIVGAKRRKKAIEAFLHDFPGSKRADAARMDLLRLLLEESPRSAREIHELAQTLIDHATPDQRAYQENLVAYDLADAPPNGIDLSFAATWAKDAVNRTTLQATADALRDSSAQ